MLNINTLQTDGSSVVSVWPLTRFRRWIRGGIVVQVLVWLEWWCYSGCFWAFSCFRCIQSSWFASLVWSPFADLVVNKDSDFCWIFDGWMKVFCWVYFWIQYSVQGIILEKMWLKTDNQLVWSYHSFQSRFNPQMLNIKIVSWFFWHIKQTC